jgi:hypothetical protein
MADWQLDIGVWIFVVLLGGWGVFLTFAPANAILRLDRRTGRYFYERGNKKAAVTLYRGLGTVSLLMCLLVVLSTAR